MPVRFRITLLFTLVVVLIWGIVCASIYYISYNSRITVIKTRLTNRAITTEKFIEQSEIFDQELIRRIDSSTTLALKRKSVQAYLANGTPVYYYSELPDDTLAITRDLIDKTLENGTVYFTEGDKEVMAFHNPTGFKDLVVLCAAVDEDGKAALSRLRNILLLCFFSGALLTFIGGYIFSVQLLRPVGNIAKEVTDISVYSLERRIKASNNSDEWSYLARTLNELLDRLKESFELQRRFISNASHELSTPLTIISSQLEISLQRHRTEEDYRKVMQNVLLDVHHMTNLVQTLLKFATASGNAGGLDIDLVRIDEIIMRLPATMYDKEKGQSVSLEFKDLPEDQHSLLVLGNEELLFTAVRNIVANACKYSDDHHARVLLSVISTGFRIDVIDNGIGIPEKDLTNIFQPFYRAGEPVAVSGFGLGLSLAMRIIRLHKGDISVRSTPGKGSVFSIELPSVH